MQSNPIFSLSAVASPIHEFAGYREDSRPDSDSLARRPEDALTELATLDLMVHWITLDSKGSVLSGIARTK